MERVTRNTSKKENAPCNNGAVNTVVTTTTAASNNINVATIADADNEKTVATTAAAVSKHVNTIACNNVNTVVTTTTAASKNINVATVAVADNVKTVATTAAAVSKNVNTIATVSDAASDDTNIVATTAAAAPKNLNAVATIADAASVNVNTAASDAVYNNVITATTNSCQETKENLDEEIALLTKRLHIKQLQQELAQLEVNSNPILGSNFADLESALPVFTADDATMGVHDFFIDFESVLKLSAGAEANKLLWLRRSLRGTAKLFLNTTHGLDYEDLKAELINEFGSQVRRHDVYQKLAHRKWESGRESIHAYILTMQAIAKRSHIDESEVLQFILEGLHGKVDHIDLFMSAHSVSQLKNLVERYQGSKLMLPRRQTVQINPTVTRRAAPATAVAKPADEPLCFNCSKRGHIKVNCPYPLRAVGSCFKCWKQGHNHHNCPNERKILKPIVDVNAVGEVAEYDDDCDGDDSYNMVSVAFKNESKGCAATDKFLSLFDTGSPNSFVSSNILPKTCKTYDEKRCFLGFGGGRTTVKYFVIVEIKFKGKKYFAKLYVVPGNLIKAPIIFGRDFLKRNNMKLIRTKLVYSKEQLVALKINTDGCTPFGEILCQTLRGFDFLNSKCNSCNIDNSIPDIFNIDIDSNDDTIDVDDKLPIADRNNLLNLIKQNYVYSANKNSKPLQYKMKIHLTSDIPFHCTPRRLSYAERDNVSKIIADLKKNGIVRPSNSPYASGIVLVKKKNGQTRLCVDYRNLNRLTVRDNFPLPLIDDCIDYLEGKSIFSVLDLKSGFHQVEVSEESIPYTAFVTPTGQYEYLRMPFGLKNAPAVFQRFINKVFDDLVSARKIMIYLDDVVIASSNLSEHMELLREVLERVSARGIQLNLAKCMFGYARLDYLGYSVSADGISLTDAHVVAIKKYPMPTNYKQLHSCMGLFSYFRRFVPNFSRLARPLLNLLKKDVQFNFDDVCVKAFQELKSKLICAPVLSIFNPSKETELHCDASSAGFGAVLLQRQGDAKFHPVAYFSKTTTAAEARYHSFELETLAIIYALRRFRIYVEGIPLTIVTDCNSLATTLSRKQVNARIARWALELENYNYKIIHRGGLRMAHADALSRCQFAAMIDVGDIDFQIQVAQELDVEIKAIKDRLETDVPENNFCLEDGLVCKKNPAGRNLLYVPNNMQDNVIRTVHEKLGHLAVDKTCEEIFRLYWFPKARTKVTKFIQNCLKCIMYSVPLGQRHRNIYTIPKEAVPFDTLHIDHFGPLPSLKSKRKHILVVIDAFTKYVKLYATNSTSSREAIAALSKYFLYYSRPRRIISDRGTCFTSNEFSEFMLGNNVQHIQNAVSAPQANGQVERVNRSLKNMLSKISDPIDHSDWTKKLDEIEFAMNNSIHSSTKTAPSMLLFGVLQRGKIVDEFSEYVEDLLNRTTERDLVALRQTAATNIVNSQLYNEQYFLKHSRPAKAYSIGDVVVIRNVDTTVGRNKKLVASYKGPYVIHKSLGNDRYVVRDLPNCQLTQLPYDGVIEANRIRKLVFPNTEAEPEL